MSSSSVGLWDLAGWSFNSNPRTERSLVILEYPSSPVRPFSRASSVARLIPAISASFDWLSRRLRRFAATSEPSASKSICLIYHAICRILQILNSILGHIWLTVKGAIIYSDRQVFYQLKAGMKQVERTVSGISRNHQQKSDFNYKFRNLPDYKPSRISASLHNTCE